MDLRRTPEQTDLTKVEGDPTTHADPGFRLGNSTFSLEETRDNNGTTHRKLSVTGPANSPTGTAIATALIATISAAASTIPLTTAALLGAPWWASATLYTAALTTTTLTGHHLLHKHHPPPTPPPTTTTKPTNKHKPHHKPHHKHRH